MANGRWHAANKILAYGHGPKLRREEGAAGHRFVEENKMKKFIMGTALALVLSTAAHAETVGVSMALFDDNFLTVLRNGMQDYSKTLKGVTLQVEDAQNDVAKQQSQIQNFIASKVDAIIVNPVDTDATAAMSKIAADAGIPLVYVNREPVNVDSLPDKQAFVASNEQESGTLEAKEVCRLLGGKGKAVVMMGELSNQAARMRTKDVHDVIATDECKGIQIIEEQTANWSRTQGSDLLTNWLSSGLEFDAVISNNDEMAIGAIQALKAAGKDLSKIVIGGVDATQDALAAMQAGDLDVTVFQDAAGQGKGALDAALKLAKGEKIEKKVYIPFQLVTPENVKDFVAKN
jgi:ABC-type sugar transport system substrate-binding protein